MDWAAPERVTGTQSIRRAILILRIVEANGGQPLPLVGIARLAGLSRPTAHRILQVLVTEGVIRQEEGTRHYLRSSGPSLLSPVAPDSQDELLGAANPVLDRLVASLGEAVFLTLHAGLDAICIARRIGRHPEGLVALELGARRPMGIGTAGIAMLAAMPEEEAQRIAGLNRARLREHGLSVPRVLRLIEEARQGGCSLRERGLVAGTKAVSVALRAPRRPYAALTVGGAEKRMPTARLLEIAAMLRLRAAEISAAWKRHPAEA